MQKTYVPCHSSTVWLGIILHQGARKSSEASPFSLSCVAKQERYVPLLYFKCNRLNICHLQERTTLYYHIDCVSEDEMKEIEKLNDCGVSEDESGEESDIDESDNSAVSNDEDGEDGLEA